mmetsp:Transcript_26719/g.62627  ORF Transcript_26719/g.62627 Transcript_26719/m.62627 type:complete len:296 (+) Transcript_26719:55-942(+)
MECRRLSGFAFAVVLAVLAPARAGRAGNVRRAAAPALQAEAAGPQAQGPAPEQWQAALRESLSVDFWQLMPKAPKHVEMAKEPKSQGNSSQAMESGEKAEQQASQPVSMQVPQEELDKLSGNLSRPCEDRFAAMLSGDGPALHSFGGPHGNNATLASCTKLNGSLCDTKANIMHSRNAPNGRTLRSSLEAVGQGCLPTECLSKADLQVLAGFMQFKARQLVPGSGVEVELRVDCTQSGGSMAAIGVNAEQENTLAAKHEDPTKAVPTPEAVHRSAAMGLAASGMFVVVAVALAQV